MLELDKVKISDHEEGLIYFFSSMDWLTNSLTLNPANVLQNDPANFLPDRPDLWEPYAQYNPALVYVCHNLLKMVIYLGKDMQKQHSLGKEVAC